KQQAKIDGIALTLIINAVPKFNAHELEVLLQAGVRLPAPQLVSVKYSPDQIIQDYLIKILAKGCFPRVVKLLVIHQEHPVKWRHVHKAIMGRHSEDEILFLLEKLDKSDCILETKGTVIEVGEIGKDKTIAVQFALESKLSEAVMIKLIENINEISG